MGRTPTSGETKRNQSIAKALQIIEVMSAAEGPMRLQAIGKAVQLPPSTVLRILKTLKDHDFVEQNPETLQYFLTLKFCRIGNQIERQTRIRDIVHPHLVEISRKLGESSSLAVERDMLVVYVDVVEGPDRMLQTLQRIGKIAPMNTTGVGKALLLDYSMARIDELIEARGLPKPTGKTISSKRSLLKELTVIRERGYATDDEECETGVRCVAAPLRDFSGNIVAAISTSAPVERMTPDRIAKIGMQFIEVSQRISKQLGYDESNSQYHESQCD